MRAEQILLILLGRKGSRSGLQATLASMLIVRASPELRSRARLRRRVSRVFIMLGLVWSVRETGTDRDYISSSLLSHSTNYPSQADECDLQS